MTERKTIEGEPAAATEIFKRLLDAYNKDGTTNVAALLCATGALGGFAAQQAVWKSCIEPGRRNPGDFLVKLTTKPGETLYFGEPVVMFLQATGVDMFSFYSFVAGAVPDSTKLPDLREIYKRVAADAGTKQYWNIHVPPPPGGFPIAPQLLNDHWAWVEETLIRHGNTPAQWPAIIGFAGHRAIRGATNIDAATVYCRVVMETAIRASKIDPRLVVGATSGLDPSGAWNDRASKPDTQREVIAEVLPLLPKEVPR